MQWCVRLFALVLLGSAVLLTCLSPSSDLVPASLVSIKESRAASPSSKATSESTEKVMKPDAIGFRKTIRPFLKKHCLACHGPDDDQGKFRVDKQLANDFLDLTAKGHWAEVVNVLNGHEMPPEGEKQPSHKEVAKVVDWITVQMTRAELYRRDSAIVLRRLNRDEYKRTMQDLLGVKVDVSSFPPDPATGGFDNNGSALIVSPMHMELYQKMARLALDRALVEGKRPKKIKWRFEPETGNSDSNRVKIDDKRNRSIIVNGGKGKAKDGYKILQSDKWDRNNINVRTLYLNEEGNYIVRIHAAGRVPDRTEVIASVRKVNNARLADMKKKKAKPSQIKWYGESFEKGIKNHFQTSNIYNYGSPRFKLIQNLGGQPVVRAEIDVDAKIGSPETYEVPVYFTKQGAGLTVKYAYDIPNTREAAAVRLSEDFARPEVWVDWIELEGPIYESWPPPSHRQILFHSSKKRRSERLYAREVLAKFMRRAYRRPVTTKEVNSKLELFTLVRKSSPSFVEAIKTPLTAILISPDFLYLAEPNVSKRSPSTRSTTTSDNAHKPRPLNSHELACRLSYFLWSTMPDEELFKLADSRRLIRKTVLTAQVDRMLKDPKSAAFHKNFAGQWLGLREVGANPPTVDLYPRYDRHLETSIVTETEQFFAEILNEDLSIINFVDSNFVVINERLARFYEIDGVKGDHFRKVRITKKSHRGGVLTQASFLSTTSNGTRTLPVKRGRWVMDNIFGIDPGLPVANVGEISPKVPGIDKATVRQRLELHRKLPQCARCHNRIDPLGLALENFNAAGEWREREGFGYRGLVRPDDPMINVSSRLPDGTKIVGITGLKKELKRKKELFYSCLSGKMMTYALGRELGITDQKYKKDAVRYLKRKDETLRDLIKFVVTSEPFLTK